MRTIDECKEVIKKLELKFNQDCEAVEEGYMYKDNRFSHMSIDELMKTLSELSNKIKVYENERINCFVNKTNYYKSIVFILDRTMFYRKRCAEEICFRKTRKIDLKFRYDENVAAMLTEMTLIKRTDLEKLKDHNKFRYKIR